MRWTHLLVAASLVHTAILPALVADSKIDGVQFGEVISGPKLKPDDLRGHVVLVELWGLH
jgi:hypothetical protein